MNYYFTFGNGHYNNQGRPMRSYWVRVVAEDYATARMIFVAAFTKVYMPRSDAFSMQYEEKYFIKKFFPGGEYAVIGEKNLIG